MHHQNIVRLRHAYFVDDQRGGDKKKPESQWKGTDAAAQEKEKEKDKKKKKGKKGKEEEQEALLHIVMDYIPSNVYRVQKHF